jgi:ribosome-binding protein aMBF1 (putative translation factor)
MSAAKSTPPAPSSSTQLRAKHLTPKPTRTERPLSDADAMKSVYACADLLDEVITQLGVSKVDLAKALGVDEKIVRELCRGDRVLTIPRLMRMPHDVACAVLIRLIRDIETMRHRGSP